MATPHDDPPRRLFPRSREARGLDEVLGEAAERLNDVDPLRACDDSGDLRPVLRLVRAEDTLPRADQAS